MKPVGWEISEGRLSRFYYMLAVYFFFSLHCGMVVASCSTRPTLAVTHYVPHDVDPTTEAEAVADLVS